MWVTLWSYKDDECLLKKLGSCLLKLTEGNGKGSGKPFSVYTYNSNSQAGVTG